MYNIYIRIKTHALTYHSELAFTEGTEMVTVKDF